jgi:hypothetical protein
MTPEQKKAAEFYAKATPRQARRRALRKYRVKLSDLMPPHDNGQGDHQQERADTKDRD